MKYKIPERKLKERGYTYVKAYSSYRTYYKEFGMYTILLWVAGKQIQLAQWSGASKYLLEFFKANIDHPEFNVEHETGFKPIGAIEVRFNRNTGAVEIKDEVERIKYVRSRRYNEYEEKYKDWINFLLHRKELIVILREIEALQEVEESFCDTIKDLPLPSKKKKMLSIFSDLFKK